MRAHLLISGRVQGVWYRQSTKEAADRIGGLTGWVRNLPDGRVEAVAEGSEASIERLIAWCREGPRLASVSDIEVSWQLLRPVLDTWQQSEQGPFAYPSGSESFPEADALPETDGRTWRGLAQR